MRRLIWSLTWVGVALWSLLAWATYGLVNLVGDLAIRHSDAVTGEPVIVEWLSWGLSVAQGFGFFAVLVVWGLVSAAILAAGWVGARVTGLRQPY